jgi:hypothetical protein
MLRHLLFLTIIVSIVLGAQHTYETEEWAALFHVKNNQQSDIADPSFYLSKERTLESEYIAATAALDQKDANITLCRYPARFRYLNKKLNLDLSFDHCDNFMQFLNESRGESASISFASAYLESPMSLFGHTFITVHKPDNRFFSQTISFAAEVPEKVNFFELAGKGIGGGFSGKFVAAPYFKLFEGYNMVEQRGISEYQLNLNQEEIENMLWHVYELYDISVDYKFLTNNCAFETLWLLEVARPSMHIVDHFNGVVIPYQTITTLKKIGLVSQIQTQPSSIESLFEIYSTLNDDEKEFFHSLQLSENKKEMIQTSILDKTSKDKMGYLINSYYDLLFKRYRMGKADFDEVKTIPYTPYSELINGEPSQRGGSKFEIGYLRNQDKDWALLSLKPYSMNRLEDRFSVLGDATLEIMNIDLLKENNEARVESLSVFNLESYTKQFDFYKPPSWKLQIGADRLLDNKLNPVMRFGIGGSWGTENILGYIIPQMTLYPSLGDVGLDITSGVGTWYENMHIGLDYTKSIAYSSKSPEEKINFYWVIQHSNMSLKLSNESHIFKASVVYQF